MPVKTVSVGEEAAVAFGLLVQRLRAPRSQPELISGHRFSTEWLSKVENGRLSNIGLNKLAELSEALGLPKTALERYLTHGEPLPEAQDSDDDISALRLQVDLLSRRVEELERPRRRS